jgi:ssRNA-specific RNase YbeY (16S rRNA maturation enzyme)
MFSHVLRFCLFASGFTGGNVAGKIVECADRIVAQSARQERASLAKQHQQIVVHCTVLAA